jgi:hypothetical protein
LTDEYSGPERRQFARRDDDRKCPNCDILWKHHDEDRREHREAICREIKKVAGEVKEVDQKIAAQGRAHSAFVPRWMFLSALGAALTLGIGMAQYLAGHINRGNDEIGRQIAVVQRRITETDQGREALKDKLIELQWSVNAIGNRLSLVEAKMEKPSK